MASHRPGHGSSGSRRSRTHRPSSRGTSRKCRASATSRQDNLFSEFTTVSQSCPFVRSTSQE